MNSRRTVAAAAVLLSVLLLNPPLSVSASPTLRQGSNGHDVLILQKKLKEIGYTITAVDGVFGAETKKAVNEFQRDQKIKVTGIVNNSTWRALKDAKRKPNAPVVKDLQPTPSVKNGKFIMDNKSALRLIATAKKYIGTPYAFGGTTPKAFDCSGYMQYVFRENGMSIPRLADEQYSLGVAAKSKKELVPGDLVFFANSGNLIDHVGLYIGKNQFIHASSSKGVRIDALDNAYWQPRYYGGKRIVK